MITELRPTEAGGTSVDVVVEGQAWDKYQQERTPRICVGTGRLEGEIGAILRARLAGR